MYLHRVCTASYLLRLIASPIGVPSTGGDTNLSFAPAASGATALTHLDGCGHEESIQTILHRISELSMGYPAGRVQLHLAGGFRDTRGVSEELTLSLLSE